MKSIKKHTHNFVEEYDDFVGFGFNRKIDENTIIYYLQKFSDDELIKNIISKFSDDELNEIFNLITKLLKKYLTEPDYHKLFLKDDKGFTKK